MKIVINGKLMSLNKYTQEQKRGRYFGGKAKKDNTLYCKNQILEYLNKHKDVVLDWPYKIVFTWYWTDKRTDPDNIAFAKKYILDGFQEAGLLSNDNWMNILGFEDHFKIDKDNPRIELEFVKVEK